MSQILPVPSTEPWEIDFEADLDGVTYRMRWHYRQRPAGGSWYLDLATAAGEPIVTGRRVTPGEDLTSGILGDDVPPGRFVTLGRDPYPRAALGRELIVLYVPAAEVPSPASPAAVTVS